MNKLIRVAFVFVSLLLLPLASFANKSPAESTASVNVTNTDQASVEGPTNTTVNVGSVVNSSTTSVGGSINVDVGYVFVPEQEVHGALCFSSDSLSAWNLMKIEAFAEERGLEWEEGECLHGEVLEDGYYAPILVQQDFLMIPGSRVHLGPSDNMWLKLGLPFILFLSMIYLALARRRTSN